MYLFHNYQSSVRPKYISYWPLRNCKLYLQWGDFSFVFNWKHCLPLSLGRPQVILSCNCKSQGNSLIGVLETESYSLPTICTLLVWSLISIGYCCKYKQVWNAIISQFLQLWIMALVKTIDVAIKKTSSSFSKWWESN